MYCAGPEDRLRILVSARPSHPLAWLPHQRERLLSPSRRAEVLASIRIKLKIGAKKCSESLSRERLPSSLVGAAYFSPCSWKVRNSSAQPLFVRGAMPI
jgi:hypothetical protein